MNNLDRLFSPEPAVFAAAYLKYLQSVLNQIDPAEIGRLVATLLSARDRGATIFFIGNGGSAATASHFVNDLSIATGDHVPPFRALSLSDNVPSVTAIANDTDYKDVFSRQLRVHARPGDVVVAISASGNSPNLIRAFAYARANGIRSVALTAFDGGQLRTVADEGVHVPTESGEYGPAEDAHLILNHVVSAYLMRYLKRE